MDKTKILEALIDRFAGGNKSKFARLLDIPPQTLHSWLSRSTYDADLIFAKIPGVSASWLLSGKGDIIEAGHGNYLGNGIANRVTVGVGDIPDTGDFAQILAEKDKQISRLLDIVETLTKNNQS